MELNIDDDHACDRTGFGTRKIVPVKKVLKNAYWTEVKFAGSPSSNETCSRSWKIQSLVCDSYGLGPMTHERGAYRELANLDPNMTGLQSSEGIEYLLPSRGLI